MREATSVYPGATMNKLKTMLGIVVAGAMLMLVHGCATNKDNEVLLTQAGFKTIPATTDAQQAHLKSLPEHKVSVIQRKGQTYYVYPDASHNVLYVGQAEQYQRYEKLLDERNQQMQQLNQREVDEDTGWNAWGPAIAFP
jgi:hypothetical protein